MNRTELHRITALDDYRSCCEIAGMNCDQGRECPLRMAYEPPEVDVESVGWVGTAAVVLIAIAALVCAASPIFFGVMP